MLKASNISKSYLDVHLLNDIDVLIESGDRLALTGKSGSGKTTLINILAGLDNQFSGDLQNDFNKTLVVFQDAGLFSHKTIKENISYAMNGKIKNQEEYKYWLELCDLTAFEKHYPYQLSRGMKQKVAIIRGFISSPDLLFLDEPFSSLDRTMTEKITAHITATYTDTTIVVASHAKLDSGFYNKKIHLI